MPFVTVHVWNEQIPDELLDDLARRLPGWVARSLDVSEVTGPDSKAARLTTSDIEITWPPTSRRDVHGNFDISISVEAMRFPERLAILPKAKESLQSSLARWLPELLNGQTWLTLVDAEYGEFIGRRKL